MNWFDASNFTNIAKNALKEAQKTIDKALEISEEDTDEVLEDDSIKGNLTLSNKISNENDKTIQTEPKSSNNSIWESLGKPFFENSKNSEIIISDSQTNNEKKLVICDNKSEISKEGISSDENVNNECDTVIVGSCSIETSESPNAEIPELNVSYTKHVDEPSIDISSSSIELIDNCNYSDEHQKIKTSSADQVDTISDDIEIVEHENRFDNITTPENLHMKNTNKSSIDVCKSLPSEIILPPFDLKLLDEMPEHSKLSEDLSSDLNHPLLLQKIARNEHSNTSLISINTIDSSSCDESTMIGSSSDEMSKDHTNTSMSSGSLKIMLAEAISEQPEEYNQEASSPTTSSLASQQENLKIGSSHTSADELDTCTSSDIEIISNPNGDGSNENSRQSPAKLIYRSSKGKMSVMISSDNIIPELIGRSLLFKGHNREPSETSSGGSDDNLENDRLSKKMLELNELLDARESKLIDLSMRNAELLESNSNLQSKSDQNSAEFTRRLAELEKKYQQVNREKEALRKQVDNLKKSDSSELDEDKDQIIKELREEGEKLSKRELQTNAVIKKLRASEVENGKEITSLKKQYDNLKQDVERTKKSLNSKEDIERSQIKAINQLNQTKEVLEKRVDTLQTQLNNLTSTLVSCQKDLDEKNKKISILEDQLENASCLATQDVIQKYEDELLAEKEHSMKLETMLRDFECRIQNSGAQHSSRESDLRRENQKLLNTMEEYRKKNEKLESEMLNSTKPIVKQLEDEINKSNAAASLWEKQETNMTLMIHELEEKLKESTKNEELLTTRMKYYDNENSELTRQIFSLNSELSNKNKELNSQLEINASIRSQNEIILKEKCNEIVHLQNQLEETLKQKVEEQISERTKTFTELYKDRPDLKTLLQGDTFNQNESDSDGSLTSQTPSPRFSDGENNWFGSVDEDPGPSSSQKGSVYEGSSRPLASTTATIEDLQIQNKLKTGEVQQLQWEIQRHEHERLLLTNEITLLTTRLEEMEMKLKAQAELQINYDALLQMYGEKIEECQELKLDLEDVKEVYKIQIDELLTKSRNG